MSRRRKLDPGALRRLFRRMGPHLAKHRRKLWLAVLAVIGASVMEIARPWPLKVIFDGLLMPDMAADPLVTSLLEATGGGHALLAVSALTMLAIAVFGGICAYAQAVLIAGVGQQVVAAVRFDLYRHIQRLSHSFHDQASTGDLLARLTGDVRLMRDLLVNSVIYVAARSLVVIITLAVMLWMDWRLTLASVAVLPLMALTSARFGHRIKDAARRQRRKEGKIATAVGEGVSAISVVKGFAREAYEEARFAKQNNASAAAELRATRLEAHMDRLVQVLLATGTAIVAWYGVTRVWAGAVTPGDLLVFTAYLASLYKPVRKLAAMTGRVAKATASGERLLEILDLEPDIREAADAVGIPRAAGRIRFEAVRFAYAEGGSALGNADFEIAPGEQVALIGPSGAGKSTIGRLALRFYDPLEGRILLDGRDIRGLTLDSLREQFAVVLQESVLFATTVRDNIAYGRLDASDEEIEAAARAAQAHGFIEALPEGYDTVLGERGATLSGGQRQRIAIARAILRDAPVLILDEPLTGLDPASAEAVSAALAHAGEGRTVILTTHDLTATPFIDRVLEVRDGMVRPCSPPIPLEA